MHLLATQMATMVALNQPFLAAVKGVTVYITDFKRSLADKLAKDFFSEPSQVLGSMFLSHQQQAIRRPGAPSLGLTILGR